jgi:uncharacterized protein (DUF302 family)
MKKIYTILLSAIVALGFSACAGNTPSVAEQNKGQNVQIMTSDNSDGKITPASIDEAFTSVGLVMAGNNDMNKPFSLRFHNTYYKTYNLAMYYDSALTLKLIKKYPQFGALTPLTMSIWSDGSTMNISTLSIEGMARTGEIPLNDPDLVAYAALIQKALHTAMPNGHFKALNYTVKFPDKSLKTKFEADVEETDDIDSFKEDFEAEFEGEMEPLGFLMPNYINMKEELFDDETNDQYDFYDTYSICKFDVIYPVSRLHPEAGAFAPCSMYIYKKKGEDKMHMGWLNVDNWITTLDIEDEESIKPLREAQGMIEKIMTELTE